MASSDLPPMHPCTASFAAAIGNPFSPQALGSCIPVGNADTLKASSKVRFSMKCGEDGHGYIQLYPTPYNDIISAATSKASYTALFWDTQEIGAPTTDIQTNSGLPFSWQTWDTITGRVVSVGVRVKYVGKLSDRNGTIDMLVQPAHQTLSSNLQSYTQMNQGNLTSYKENYHEVIDNRTFEMSMYPLTDAERQFPPNFTTTLAPPVFVGGLANYASSLSGVSTYFYPLGVSDWAAGNGGAAAIPCPNNLILITGSPGDNYDVEMITHCEYIGKGATFGTTKVEADPVGVQNVTAAAAQASIWESATHSSFAQGFLDSLKEVAVDAAHKYSAPAARMLVRSLVSGAAAGAPYLSRALMN